MTERFRGGDTPYFQEKMSSVISNNMDMDEDIDMNGYTTDSESDSDVDIEDAFNTFEGF